MTDKQYAKLVQTLQKRSPLAMDALRAFLIGGTICALAQLLSRGLVTAGLDRDTAGTVVSVILVFVAALLTGLGVFDELAKFAGAGTLVPITGFANAMVAPALEYKSEGLVTGTAVKLFTVAGPVLVYGITASTVYGVIYWLVA